MKNRICIFSFYDAEGYVDDYVLYLLDELKLHINRLIIVVNGILDERGYSIFSRYTKEVYLRENKGLDAGAYKDILISYLSSEELKEYDELIFCNDTFFGPFISMATIFDNMDSKKCDIWGLNGYFEIVFSHIQSYFLVFRKPIIINNCLIEYFERYIDGETTSINKVCCQFESGIFDFLVREKGFSFDVFSDNNNIDIYRLGYFALSEYNVPIVKKKSFASFENDKDNILCTLSYVKYCTDYDVNYILKCINRKYGLFVKEEEVKELHNYKIPNKYEFPIALNSEKEIEKMLGKNEFYIYGTGIYAHKTYWRFGRENNKFKGFIISDNQSIDKMELFDCPIYKFSDVKDIYDTKVILGVGVENTLDIMKNFIDLSNVIRIF